MPVRFFSRKAIPDVTSCRFRQSARVLAARQGDEATLFDVAGERYFALNQVGTLVWSELAEPSTLAELAAMVCREYNVVLSDQRARVAQDVADLLGSLHTAGLILTEPREDRQP